MGVVVFYQSKPTGVLNMWDIYMHFMALAPIAGVVAYDFIKWCTK